MKEQYTPSQEDVKKAESMMSNAQKELTKNIEEHHNEMEKMQKKGVVYTDFLGTSLKGMINGHEIDIMLEPDKDGKPTGVAEEGGAWRNKIDGKDISKETAQKIVDKYLPIAFSVKEANRLIEKHNREGNIDDIVDDLLK